MSVCFSGSPDEVLTNRICAIAPALISFHSWGSHDEQFMEEDDDNDDGNDDDEDDDDGHDNNYTNYEDGDDLL